MPGAKQSGQAADRYGAFCQGNCLNLFEKTDWPQAEQPLILGDSWRRGEPGGRVGRNSQQVTGREQDGVESMAMPVLQCSAKPADRAETGGGMIRQARQAVPASPAQHETRRLRGERVGHMGQQRLAPVQGQRLVAAEAACLAAGQDGAQDARRAGQAVSSNSSRPIR